MSDFKDLKKATDIDPNVWYHLTEEWVDDYNGNFTGMLQTYKEDSGDDGFRVYAVKNRKTYWQFQPIDKIPGRYSLRCSETTTRKQFAVCYRDFESVENRRTRACLTDSDGTESQQWDVSLWGTNTTETYLFTNVANGTKYHLDVIPGNAVFMSPNLDGYQKRQRWLMTSVKNVDDDAYSTVFTNPPPESTRDAGTTTDSSSETATDSASSSSSDSSSSSLSNGAIAGIAIGAVLGVLAIALLGFFLWRRKRRNAGLTAKPDEAMTYLVLGLATLATCTSSCTYQPSSNATLENFPRASPGSPYDPNILSQVPVASVCSCSNATEELACARRYIDIIDEQLAFLYARRLGYAAIAGFAKYGQGVDLNDPSRNEAVAEGMAQRVLKYGGTKEAGRVMGGEGCQIYVSLEYEVSQIQETCDPKFQTDVKRNCN
ncbi:hypothetical protein HYE67_005329 [Fusarium culmorum]|uniref:Chorismate mutase domain-containing protein n=1 Tax=Fusarium culmorum TaxID=5516 RepID=A0A7S8HVS5_FUSCU|nr:hypothetical protein HYE67_005329 [Fusarium culmorum]